MSSRIQSQTGQIHGKSQRPQHQIGTYCRVSYHVNSGTESPHENPHYNWSPGQSQLYRKTDTRNRQRNWSQQQPQYHPDKNGHQIRLIQILHGIPHHVLHLCDGRFLPDHRQPITQLQGQIRRGQQHDTRPVNAGYIYPVLISQPQRS